MTEALFNISEYCTPSMYPIMEMLQHLRSSSVSKTYKGDNNFHKMKDPDIYSSTKRPKFIP